MNDELNGYDSGLPQSTDSDLATMLVDAYATPPMPRSLQRRLDRLVVEQWDLADAIPDVEPLHQPRRPFRVWKAWSVAASLAAAILLVVSFWGNEPAYGWTKMLDALSRQRLIKIVDDGSGNELLHDASATGPDERFVLSLLLGDLGPGSGGISELSVIEEHWERHGDRVQLDVVLRIAPRSVPSDSQTIDLRVWLDAESHLPLHSRITARDGKTRQVDFYYPPTAPSEFVAQATSPGPSPAATKANAVASETASSAVAVDDGDQGSQTTEPDAAAPNDTPPTEELIGAASLDWTPLPILELSPNEYVRRVDLTLQRLWMEKGVEPTGPAGDEELLRRVYLDLAGRTPTVHEIRRYLDDPSPDRYSALVDRLLASGDHATHLATVWRNMLLPAGTDLTRFGGVEKFDEWLGARFRKNTPYDELVRQLLSAEGRLSSSGPLLFYAAHKLEAEQLAAKSARVFLGMRLECAQCHDDPFEPWTQQDFWSYAAFFARISRPEADLESVSTVMRVRDIDRGEVTLPDSDQVVAPRMLDRSEWNDSPESTSRRQQLARWLTAPENPFFAKAAANRVWAHLFGRGIIDPVDGFGKQNEAASPELLDLLASQFVHQKFDLRGLFRTVVLSRAYRLSSGSQTPDPRRQEWFAQQNVKMLTAEQLYDCISVAALLDESHSREFTISRVGNSRRSEFIQQFQTIAGTPTEYQRGIPHSLTLMNGDLIRDATGLTTSGLLKSLEAPFFTDDARIEVIYLATLSRRPTPDEWQAVRKYIHNRDADTSVIAPLGDVLWALLNSAEFAMNH